MLPKFFYFKSLLAVALFFFVGCNKNEDTSAHTTNSFRWTYMNTNYSGKENEASIYSLGPHVVVAGMDRNTLSINRRLSFTLTSFTTGTYNVGIANSNSFSYVDDSGDELLGKAGTITITQSSNFLLSGNFSCTLLGSSNTSSFISGSFTNVPVKP